MTKALQFFMRSACYVGCFGFVCVLLALTPITDQIVYQLFYVPPVLKQADVIVVFSSGMGQNCQPDRVTLEREIYGLTLLQKGLSKSGKIIFTGGDDVINKVNIGHCMTQLAEDLGFEKNRLVTEPLAKTTYENAVYTNQIMKQHQWQSVLLVTSMTHMKRSLNTMKNYPIHVYAGPVPFTCSSYFFDVSRLSLIYEMLREYAGNLKYSYYNLYTPPSAHP